MAIPGLTEVSVAEAEALIAHHGGMGAATPISTEGLPLSGVGPYSDATLLQFSDGFKLFRVAIELPWPLTTTYRYFIVEGLEVPEVPPEWPPELDDAVPMPDISDLPLPPKRPWYKNPWVISLGLGGAALVVLVVATRKQRGRSY